jgi:hypothetical protein
MADSKKTTGRSSTKSTSGGSRTKTRSSTKTSGTDEKMVDKAKSMIDNAATTAKSAAEQAQVMAGSAASSARETAADAVSIAMEQGEMMVEQIETTGSSLVERVREIIQEGNARHIRIRNEEGDTILEMPLTAGVVLGSGVAVAMMAAIGGLASTISNRVHIDVRKPRTGSSPRTSRS